MDERRQGFSLPRTLRCCLACGKNLSHKRYGAKTCSAKCRKALSRGVTKSLSLSRGVQ